MKETYWKLAIVFFVIGLVLGCFLASIWYEKRRFRNTDEVVEILEKMLFNYSYAEDKYLHSFGENLMLNNKTTLGELRHYYKLYMPISQGLLKGQVERLCYTTKWED